MASLWSRQLTFVSIAKGTAGTDTALASIGDLELPFCPGELASSGDGSKLVVADAFGGRLAVVDTRRRAIESVRTIPGHNIRGMAFAPDGKSLVIAHQYLNHLAQTTFDDVHWGLLIRNHLRVLRTDALLEAGSDSALLEAAAVRPGRRRICGWRPGLDRVRQRRQLDRRPGGCRRDRDHGEPRPGPAANRGGAPANGGGAEPRRVGRLRGRQSGRHGLGCRDQVRHANSDDLAGAPARADFRPARRAAVLQCQALARRLDELP